jgi:hypothetical protein
MPYGAKSYPAYAPVVTPKPAKKPDAQQFGKIKFEGKDLPPQPATYDKLAIGPKKELLYVSLVAEANFVKAIRAILGGGAKAHISASGGKVKVPNSPHSVAADPHKLVKAEEGYECFTHKLEYGLIHACFVARTDGFMLNVSDEALKAQLSDTRFTTPFLPEWITYIREQMTKGGILQLCPSFNCECAIITSTEAQFDFVVSNGLKTGKLIIPGG